MNLSKPVNPTRNYAVGSVITSLILLSPVVAFLMVIAAEMLIDLLIVGGERAQCAQSRPAASDWFCPASSGNVIFTRGKSGRGGGPSEAADTVQALRQRVH